MIKDAQSELLPSIVGLYAQEAIPQQDKYAE